MVRFTVKVKPNSRQTGYSRHAAAEQPAVISLKAPPVDGKANRALIDFLARELGTRKRDVTIVSGAGSRTKTVEVRAPASLPPPIFGKSGG
ncbi:MAG: DUF167 domain-containing protein [Proteobacteria bacterium]|nr:MAG: DUF167 domain-containing protein [Pseudomonadota bacterium]